ncbi:nitrile hydratase subunit alpha [Caballeronia sp. LZ001]|uniref:nitrile hydratase subunit alpha n=1 Tax=Caballeronia sp. LZ001 TaxID=3038553 RepID=UPI0028665144|nr:nitrile hydratase subunit alpha [Caballeronia sp. LZ001]MDR5804774.1 nitrile hydratase subunit alpha [Caballeronia sp. LZ001]
MTTSPIDARVDAFETLLVNNKVLQATDAADYKKHVEEDWLPSNGARLCAKAWTDPEFKQFLLTDGKAAAASQGFPMPPHHGCLMVKENTEAVHNVIVCTLCSCTAITIVGLAPGWYKDLDYRARVVRDGRSVLAEMGLSLPEEMKLFVWDTTADTRYMVLPMRPPGTDGWSEEQLAQLVDQDSLIGVRRLEPPFEMPTSNYQHLGA